jgi:hypothetical protein
MDGGMEREGGKEGRREGPRSVDLSTTPFAFSYTSILIFDLCDLSLPVAPSHAKQRFSKRVPLSQVYFIAYTVFEWGDTRSADLLLDGHSIGISSQMLVFPPLRDPWYNASTLVASRDDWQVTLWKHARDHALNAIVHSEMKSARTLSSSSHARDHAK